jgi:hypothetical protein
MSDNNLTSSMLPFPENEPRKEGESAEAYQDRLKRLEDYQMRTKTIIQNEKEFYLTKRRKQNGLPEPTDDNLVGLCISGGGVRSATLGLGMFQAFIENGKLKLVDYLSTVSGGGFIGSCLSSLLSNEHPWEKLTIENPEKNLRFNGGMMGVDKENAPFAALNNDYEYQPLQKTTLSARHQLFHLRKYGEYLTPRKNLFSWDVNRAVGALATGIVINLVVLGLLISGLVLMHHVILGSISKNSFMDNLRHSEVAENIARDKAFKAKVLFDLSKHWKGRDSIYQRPVDSVLREVEIGMVALTSDKSYFWYLDSAITYKKPKVIFSFKHSPVLDSLANDRESFSRFCQIRILKDTLLCLDTLKTRPDWDTKSQPERISVWYENRLSLQINIMFRALQEEYWLAGLFVVAGLLIGIFCIWFSYKYPYKIAKMIHDERIYDGTKGAVYSRNGGDDLEYFVSRNFRRVMLVLSVAVGPALAFTVVGTINWLAPEMFQPYGYMVFLSLPFCFNLGLFVGVAGSVSFAYISAGGERVSGRLYRSFYHGTEGRVFIGLLISIVFPLIIMLLFGKHALIVYILFSLLPVATAYYFTIQSLAGKVGGHSFFSTLALRLQNPLLNLSIFLFMAFAFSLLSSQLYQLERYIQHTWLITYTQAAVFLFVWIFVLTVIAGFAVNFNDLSLHYFYRDRLAEAYLRTNGRVEQPPSKDGIVRNKDLFEVNLRNHDNLPLKELGEGNNRGPYHIIVAALNLQGSHDLAKKTLKSDHFIFSKYYIGSRTTGYARTDKYNYGATRLATAMTVSAAAISSGMGSLGFAASNFYMTMFNLRTGYWIFNPAYEHRIKQIKQKKAAGIKVKRSFGEWWSMRFSNYPFWLGYLWSELSGRLSTSSRRVYVSDGGHTGDNLGILPLIQRGCQTIIIADFEEDEGFTFASFNQAVRLAKAIYDTNIEIDLSPLVPRKSADGAMLSVKSVVTGKAFYGNGKTGKIIYMKSSMNQTEKDDAPVELNPQKVVAEPAHRNEEQMPVYVLNYLKTNPTFPHQSTSDQYFDEVQFEAYRMLGEHIGRQAVPFI